MPIYETSSAEQVAWILADSGARAVVVETAEHLARVARGARPGSSELNHVWSIDDNAVDTLTRLGGDISDERAGGAPYDRDSAGPGHPDLHLRHHRPAQGLRAHPRQLPVRARQRDRRAGASCSTTEGASTLLFLPLAHVFARIIQVGCIKSRTRLGHTADIKNLVADLADVPADVHPGRAAGVREGLQHRQAEGHRRRQGRDLRQGGRDRDRLLPRPRQGRRVPLAVRAKHAVFDRLVYGKLRAALGGKCTYAISGGAPLGERLGHFYRGIGVTVLEGYGLTETTAAADRQPARRASRSAPSAGRCPAPRSASPTTASCCSSGGQVFAGYWNNEEATAEALEPTAGSTPATSASSTTTASSGSPAARRRSS